MMCTVSAFVSYGDVIGNYGVDESTPGFNELNSYKNPPQCTWYCWGRAYQKLGISLPHWGDAKDWAAGAKRDGYIVDEVPMANSIMVEASYSPGHVMYVEKVENGIIYITEGNYKGSEMYNEDEIDISTMTRKSWSSHVMTDVSYIHLRCAVHTWNAGEILKKPSCTETGVRRVTCTVCGASEEQEIPATGHKYESNVLLKANQLMDGLLVKTCKNCGHQCEETIYRQESVDLKKLSVVYNGSAQKPGVIVKDREGNVIKPGFYTLSYNKNVSVGLATVKVKFKTRYSGSVTRSFYIIPMGTSISSLSATHNSLTAKWKMQKAPMKNSRIKGYQVEIAKDSNFQDVVKTISVNGYKNHSKKITGLSELTTYYVHVRTYLKKDGTNYFSKWSNADSIKTKKGFTYPDPGYRTFYNATANYYEFQSPSVPTYVTVNGKTAGYDESYYDTDFGSHAREVLWKKNAGDSEKQILRTLTETYTADGDDIQTDTFYLVDLTDGDNFFYTKHDSDYRVSEDSALETNSIFWLKENGTIETVYTESLSSDDTNNDFLTPYGFWDDKLIFAEYRDKTNYIYAFDLKERVLSTIKTGYIPVSSYGRYLLCEKVGDYSRTEFFNTRFVYDLQTDTVTKLPVSKYTVSYMAPTGIYNFEYAGKTRLFTRCDYRGKFKKTLLKGYDVEFASDTFAIVRKGQKYYRYTYSSGKLKKQKMKEWD